MERAYGGMATIRFLFLFIFVCVGRGFTRVGSTGKCASSIWSLATVALCGQHVKGVATPEA